MYYNKCKHSLAVVHSTINIFVYDYRNLLVIFTAALFTPSKRRLTTSHLPILEPVLKTTIPSYTIYSNSLSPSIPDILCASPWSFARFCDTCISSIWPFNTVRAVLLMFQICAALVLIFELLSWLCCTSRTLLSELHKYPSE